MSVSYYWVRCEYCKAEVAVSKEDHPEDWDEPCDVCGYRVWTKTPVEEEEE